MLKECWIPYSRANNDNNKYEVYFNFKIAHIVKLGVATKSTSHIYYYYSLSLSWLFPGFQVFVFYCVPDDTLYIVDLISKVRTFLVYNIWSG